MLIQFLKYHWQCFKYPARVDFLNMGYGIEARYRRCQKYWQPHLELSKQKQRELVAGFTSPIRIAVLGAGRLLDLDLEYLTTKASEIALYDADPSVLKVWQAAARRNKTACKITFHIGDLSECIDQWSNQLETAVSRASVTIQPELELECYEKFFAQLQAPPPTLNLEQYDLVISLNLLSQIPIYFRDRVYQFLESDGRSQLEDQPRFQAALRNALTALQRQHIKLLSSGCKLVLLICDAEYFYYQQDKAPWQVESAFYPGVEKELSSRGFWPIDSWLWHIAPQQYEYKSYGAIHRVQTFVYTKQKER